jgi:hypothetical protein
MHKLVKQTLALSISVLVSTPIFALNGVGSELAAGRIPWIAGSLFLSGIWAVFLGLLVFAPVATVSNYLIQNKLNVKWFSEPLVILGVLSLVVIPLCLTLVGWNPLPMVVLTASLFFPTLVYYYLLRAIELREYL